MSIVSAALFMATAVAAATPTPLERAVTIVRANDRAKRSDQFAIPTPLPIKPGEHVLFVSKVSDGESRSGISTAAFYTYGDGNLKLQLTRFDVGGSFDTSSITFRTRKTSPKTYRATNAYGAATTVTQWILVEDAISVRSAPHGLPDEYSGRGDKSFWVSITAAPGAARSIANDVDVVIEGSVTGVGDEVAQGCTVRAGSPTIDSPVDVTTEQCAIGVAVTRIAFVRRSIGIVLGEWTTGK